MTRHAAVVVEALAQRAVGRRRVEMVERKGVGHPDTICDSLVEAIAVALNRMYLEQLGTVAHYNVDKALLVAGQCRKWFGGGAVTRPMELIVGDRATFEAAGRKLPVEETAHAAVAAWLARHLPLVPPHLRTRIALAPGSVELAGIFTPRAGVDIVSNDTSGASGYSPLSATEEIVLAVEQWVNGPTFKTAFPDTGQDVKVFGWREDDRLSLTVAMPLLAEAMPSEPAYFQRKGEILAALAERFRPTPFDIGWRLNNLDVPGRGTDGVYLTLTGTSAEDGDSGQVGRGNRANGLIAFARPSGSEATAGKNALAHAGKVYSVFSHHLAHGIRTTVPGLAEVYVHMAARIGDPIDRPWVGIQVVLDGGVALPDVEAAIAQTVQAQLETLPEFRTRLARGEFPVC